MTCANIFQLGGEQPPPSFCLRPDYRGSVLHVFGHGNVGVGSFALLHMVDASQSMGLGWGGDVHVP